MSTVQSTALQASRSDGKPAANLLVFADDWGRHPSSCQHLVRRLRGEYSVLWVNTIGTRQVRANALTLQRGIEKLKNWGQGLQQVSDWMWVIDLPMLPGLGHPLLREGNRLLVTTYLKRTLARLGMVRPTILTTLPYIGWLIRDIKRQALIYYCTDDYSHWPSADRGTLVQADQEMSATADLILAASRALAQSHADSRQCAYFPHGVDFDHFASTQQTVAAPAVAALPRPRIGYFGLIYEKLDYALLTAVSRRFAHGSLVMIGPVASCPPEFASLPNVRLLGAQPYQELPQYLAGLDVLLLPYVNDEMIRQSGPLKLRECLASGKPTVSIDVPDVRSARPHVRIGASSEEFLDQVQKALDEPAEPTRIQARQASVAGDGWDQRADQLRSRLHPLQARKEAVNGLSNGSRLPRVLHLRTISGKGGGPEKTILNSPRFLRGLYDLRLAYIRPAGDSQYDMPARAQQMGVDLIDIPERGPVDPTTLWRLASEVAAYRPQLLHAHDPKTNILGYLLGRMFRIPVITTVHGYVTRGGRLELYYAVDRWSLRRMDHVVAVSEDLYQLLGDLGIPSSRCSLIENAIDTEQFRRRRTVAEAKERLGLAPGKIVIGAVGRLSAEKGFDLLIRSVHQLAGDGLPVHLLIAGEGDQRPELETLIAQLGCGNCVQLLGFQSDTQSLFEAMDLFVLSSLREGLPNVVLEAMAMQVPVVATRIAGVPRLVRHGETGLLVEPGDNAGLLRAMAQLIADRDLGFRLAEAGRRSAETGYSFAARMQKIRALYDSLLRIKRSK